MTTLYLTLGFIALFFIMMSVRLIFLKGGQFRGSCASQSPFLNEEGATCGYCGKKVEPGDACGDPDKEMSEALPKFK